MRQEEGLRGGCGRRSRLWRGPWVPELGASLVSAARRSWGSQPHTHPAPPTPTPYSSPCGLTAGSRGPARDRHLLFRISWGRWSHGDAAFQPPRAGESSPSRSYPPSVLESPRQPWDGRWFQPGLDWLLFRALSHHLTGVWAPWAQPAILRAFALGEMGGLFLGAPLRRAWVRYCVCEHSPQPPHGARNHLPLNRSSSLVA